MGAFPFDKAFNGSHAHHDRHSDFRRQLKNMGSSKLQLPLVVLEFNWVRLNLTLHLSKLVREESNLTLHNQLFKIGVCKSKVQEMQKD